MKKRIFLLLCVAALIAGGCKTKPTDVPYDNPLPPGELALRKITDPKALPDLTGACRNLVALQRSVDNSLSYFAKPSSKNHFPYGDVTHNRAVASLIAINKLLAHKPSPGELNQSLLDNFDVYASVGCDNRGTVLFTGYYTPIFEGLKPEFSDESPVFEGSVTRTGNFRYPLYKRPEDLETDPEGKILGRKSSGGQITPYPSRRVIETNNMLAGKELVYLSNPFEVYIAHVQGSAKIRLRNGKLITVAYNGNNGHEYVSVSKELVTDGHIAPNELNLASMIKLFGQKPNLIQTYTHKNPRFVFFYETSGNPRGSLNVEVTRLRSIATDKSIYPRGCLAMIDTVLPRNYGEKIVKRPFKGFLLDQDTGGAIRAPGRCDIYMGQGKTAERMAGYTYEEGRLYYLFVKPDSALAR